MGREERVKEVKKMREKKRKRKRHYENRKRKEQQKKRIKGDNFQNIKSKGD